MARATKALIVPPTAQTPPTIHRHINRYGTFDLGLNTRMPIATSPLTTVTATADQS